MRSGKNPNREAKVDGFGAVIVSAITHLPNKIGYHKDRLKVVQCSLETMRENAGSECQILIWDNGSNPEFTAWLKEVYKPNYLILSPNVGKSIARASIVNMLPPETIVGVADDDMFYYPGWLKAQLKVLFTYPFVGTVSGWPVRTQFRFHNEFTKRWGKENARYEEGRFISKEEDEDFCTSIGRDYVYQVGYTKNDVDVMLTYKNLPAYATGHHAQWIGYAKRVAPLLTYDKEAMANERPFERALDESGYLRLTTTKRTTQHIGNVLDEKLEALWQKRNQLA